MWAWIKRQFCSHKWEVRAAVIAHPRRNLVSAKKIAEGAAQRLMLGSTTLVYTCDKCGAVQHSEHYGVPSP